MDFGLIVGLATPCKYTLDHQKVLAMMNELAPPDDDDMQTAFQQGVARAPSFVAAWTKYNWLDGFCQSYQLKAEQLGLLGH